MISQCAWVEHRIIGDSPGWFQCLQNFTEMVLKLVSSSVY